MTPRRRILLSTAAACHLALAVIGARDICLWETPALGPALTVYSALSGIDTGYGFFAPKVASPPRAEFTIVDDEGHAIVDALPTGVTREADIRVEDLVEVFDKREDGDAMKTKLATSWAAVMFARHPRATRVTVDMGHTRVPTMAEHRLGRPPRWRSIYRARIVRSPRAGATGGSP